MPDLALAYEETRKTMSDIVRTLDPAVLNSTVPSCPAWSTKDLIAHVTGIATAIATGNGVRNINLAMFWEPAVAEAREEFVDAEIVARRGKELAEILDEWEGSATSLLPMVRGERPFPDGTPAFADWVVVTDVGVHHHDLRGAVGMPGDRDSLATGLSLRSYVEAMRFRTQAHSLPTLRIVAGSRTWTT